MCDVDKQEVFGFLDAARESGLINMFGAGPSIQANFGVDKHEARELLLEWMRTFEERHSSGD
jgi:hypothetical protein